MTLVTLGPGCIRLPAEPLTHVADLTLLCLFMYCFVAQCSNSHLYNGSHGGPEEGQTGEEESAAYGQKRSGEIINAQHHFQQSCREGCSQTWSNH